MLFCYQSLYDHLFGKTTDESNFLTSRSQWESLPLALISRHKAFFSIGSSELQAPEGLQVVRDRQWETRGSQISSS